MKHTYLRSVIAAGVVAAVLALATNTLAHPVIAGAEPNNGGGDNGWDIGAYDDCMYQQGLNEPADLPDPDQYMKNAAQDCCDQSGGQWSDSQDECVAPPADSGQQPTHRLPGQLPTAVFAPPTPAPPNSPNSPPPASLG